MIVGFGRDNVEQLVVVHDGDDRRGHVDQRAVVEASTAAQPVAGSVHRQRRHQHDVGGEHGVSAESWGRRLGDAEWSGGQVGRAGVGRPVERHGVDDREQDPSAAADQVIEQGPRRRLGVDRDEGRDRPNAEPALEAVIGDRGAGPIPRRIGHQPPGAYGGDPKLPLALGHVAGHVSSVTRAAWVGQQRGRH
jgi:hypothetical protein